MNAVKAIKKVFSVGLCAMGCLIVIAALKNNLVQAATTTESKSTGIQGTVKKDPPSTAATIAIPTNGSSVSELPVKVSGLCTGDLLVKLFKNDVFAGSAQCSNGSYALTIDLFNGSNQLVARVYDALDQVGPDSAIVTVSFVQTGFNTNAPQITLTSEFARRGANPGETLSWPIVVSGGTGPYAISVDWGDGHTELVSRSFAGEFNISHKYASPGVYSMVIKATDSTGNSAFLQLVSVGNGPLSQASQTKEPTEIKSESIVVWWPVAIALGFVIMAFWLGGKHKLDLLRRQAEDRIQY